MSKEIAAHAGEFYVYLLGRPNGEPFYVGFGFATARHHRVFAHETEARAKPRPRQNRHKIAVIKSIWSCGRRVLRQIESWHKLEITAKAREIELIAHYGRADLGCGPLTNLTAGGDGSIELSENGRRRMREGQKRGRVGRARWAELNKEKLREMGRRLGAHTAAWMRENPEAARDRQSKAGTKGIRVTHQRLKDDPEMLKRARLAWAAAGARLAKEDPARATALGKLAYVPGLGRWRNENSESVTAAARRGGAGNAARWAANPDLHAEVLRKAAEGTRRAALADPEKMKRRCAYAGSFNRQKAETRRRCIALVAEHRLDLQLPSGRAGNSVWAAVESEIVSTIALRAQVS